MKSTDLENGAKVLDTMFDKIFYVTSVTEKRVNMDDNVKSYSSTGRGSSKFYLGHKAFNENLENGRYKVL